MSAEDAVSTGQKAAESAAKGAAIGGTIGAALGPQGAVIGSAVGAFAGAAYELGQWLSDVFSDPPEPFPKVRDNFGERRMPRGWTPTKTLKWERKPGGRKLYRYRRAVEDGASRSEALRWLADATDAAGSPPAAGAALRDRAARAAATEAAAAAGEGWNPLALGLMPGMERTELGHFVHYKWLRRKGLDSVTAERLTGRHFAATGKRLEHARRVYLAPVEGPAEDEADDEPERAIKRVRLGQGARRADDDDDAPPPQKPTLRHDYTRQPVPPRQVIPRSPEETPMASTTTTIPIGPYRLTLTQQGDRVVAYTDIRTPWGPVRICAAASIATVRAALLAMIGPQLRAAQTAVAGDEDDEVGADLFDPIRRLAEQRAQQQQRRKRSKHQAANIAFGQAAAVAAQQMGQHPGYASQFARVAHAVDRARQGDKAAKQGLRRVFTMAKQGHPAAAQAAQMAAHVAAQARQPFPGPVDPIAYAQMAARYAYANAVPYVPAGDGSFRPAWI